MDIQPIFSSLRRHKTAAALIVLEIALTCAIICNAVYLIGNRLERINAPSGIADTELVRIQMAGLGTQTNAASQTQADLAALRGLPGVKQATIVSQIPYGNSAWNSSINLKPEQERSTLNAAMYMGGENFMDAMGLQLVAGRDFTAGEYRDANEVLETSGEPTVPMVVLTRAAAQRLFPAGDALGKNVYIFGSSPTQIIGIVDRLVRPNTNVGGGGDGFEYSMILPLRQTYSDGGNYMLRVEPGNRAQTLKAAVDLLEKLEPNRMVLNEETFEEIRANYFRQDKAMAWLLISVCVALLVVTALGIVGLASFWVQQRTRMIGIRRALGATRGQILRYFQIENLLLATIGIVLGMLLAYGINQLLMKHYELPRLPLMYLPVGAVLLWLLGQIAVYGPARKAASVPPAVATRSA